jgi:hypothetical protein
MKSRVSDRSEEKDTGERNLKEQAVEMNTLLARAITGPYSDSKYSQISMVIRFIQEKIELFNPVALHQKVILLMGPTGVGKSTLVNYIAGRKMIVRENPSGFALYPEHPITQVGQGNGSTTLLPNVWSADISGFEEVSFVDCAGDFDTSGVVIETINAMIKQKIASRAQQVKIIIVGTQGSLTAEGAYGAVFKEGLAKSAQFLGNITDFQENIALVVSHSNRRINVLNHIENALTSILAQSGNPLADYTGIIRYVTENNRFTYFCKPSEEAADGDEYSVPPALNQRESIVNLIRNSINFKDVQVGSYFRTSASREVQQAMGSAINIVKRKSIITLKSEMDSIISSRLSIHPAQLETFSDELERTISINDNLKLSDYVTRFNRNAFLPKITRSSINKLSSELEFLSQFANIPETNNWGSEVDIRRSFNVMTTEIGKIMDNSSEIFGTRFTHNDDIVSCIGYKVNMSEIAQFVSGKANIKEVRVFALNEVIIDRNLITPSINVCIIAPKWAIPARTTINLSGLDNNSYPDNKKNADSGTVPGSNGKPGLPGSSGGNFLGIGNEFIGLDNLTVISNGGRGGPGQNGGFIPDKTGSGRNAYRHGGNNPRGSKMYQMLADYSTIDATQGDFGHWYLTYTNYGPGQRGDNGADGGKGGIGGFGGVITITLMNNGFNIREKSGIDGTRGLDGRGSAGGRGQRDGDLWHETFHDDPRLFHTSTWHSGRHSQNTRYALNGNHGMDGASELNQQNPVRIRRIDESLLRQHYLNFFNTINSRLSGLELLNELPHRGSLYQNKNFDTLLVYGEDGVKQVQQQEHGNMDIISRSVVSPLFYEYTMERTHDILNLRVHDAYSTSGLSNTLILPGTYVFSERYNNILVLLFRLRLNTINISPHGNKNNRSEIGPSVILAPVSLNVRHAVGIMFVAQEDGNGYKAFYLDPENTAIPEALARIFRDNGYEIEQLSTEGQLYNNCGPEVIENFMLYLTGERLSQEDAITNNSRLLEQKLLSSENDIEVLKDRNHKYENTIIMSNDVEDNISGNSLNYITEQSNRMKIITKQDAGNEIMLNLKAEPEGTHDLLIELLSDNSNHNYDEEILGELYLNDISTMV